MQINTNKTLLFIIATFFFSYSDQSQDSILALLIGNWRLVHFSDDGNVLNYDTTNIPEKLFLCISKDSIDSVFPMHYANLKNSDTLCFYNAKLALRNSYWSAEPIYLVYPPDFNCQGIFGGPSHFSVSSYDLSIRIIADYSSAYGFNYYYLRQDIIANHKSNFNQIVKAGNLFQIVNNGNNINIMVNYSGNLKVINSSGSCVMNISLSKGTHILSKRTIASGLYIFRFTAHNAIEMFGKIL